MNDSILAIVASKGGKVFAALADGFVAVLQVSQCSIHKSINLWCDEPVHLPLGFV